MRRQRDRRARGALFGLRHRDARRGLRHPVVRVGDALAAVRRVALHARQYDVFRRVRPRVVQPVGGRDVGAAARRAQHALAPAALALPADGARDLEQTYAAAKEFGAHEYADALLILRGLIDEMEARYKALKKARVKDIGRYNAKAEKPLPYIVTVVDEFADLIMQGKAAERKKKSRASMQNIVTRVKVEQMARQFAKMGLTYSPPDPDDELATVEEMIVRLAQMARAVGIHLIIATQRPSVDVITGLIKANFPARIALTTASPTDSKVILGVDGAEKLTGKGDMLYMAPGAGISRLQGFITE